MFKKNISVLQKRQTSGKDSKQLRRDIQVQFPDISEDELKEILPSKSEVTVLKLSNRAQAYSVEGQILFFDPEGRGEILVPSVYTLWRLPHILPSVYTYSEVSPKVLGGADLFLQGFIVPPEGLPHFAAGDLMEIRIPGNRFPFAVGTMETSSEAVSRSGLKGKGVKLLHHYPDQLWQLGDKSIPDASFTPSRIFPQAEENGAPEPRPEGPAEGRVTEEVGRLAVAESAQREEDPPASGEESAAAPDGTAMSQDELAEFCLITGLATLSDGELPLMTSDFYSKHMLPSKPPGVTMDIKKSSYKKLSKLLQKFEKQGLLSQKIIHKQDHISAVNRSHELYRSSSNGPPQKQEQQQAQPSASGRPAGKIEITYCYRFPTSLRPILGAGAAAKDELHEEPRVREALRQYAAQAGLLDEAAGAAKLDRLLLGGLYNKKEAAAEGQPQPLSDLETRLLGKLQLYHRVTRTDEKGALLEQVNKGQVKHIVIQTEDRQGGRKHLTKVTHVESFGLVPEELAGVLQRKFQTSSSVQKLPGKNEAGKEISLQGDLLNEIPAFLAACYGIDQSFITTVSKKKA